MNSLRLPQRTFRSVVELILLGNILFNRVILSYFWGSRPPTLWWNIVNNKQKNPEAKQKANTGENRRQNLRKKKKKQKERESEMESKMKTKMESKDGQRLVSLTQDRSGQLCLRQRYFAHNFDHCLNPSLAIITPKS